MTCEESWCVQNRSIWALRMRGEKSAPSLGGNVEERKAANEDPIDVKRYIDLKNPYFVTVIQALRSSYLYVPRSVLINYELQLPQAILFHDPTGRTWRGTVKVWTDSRTWITGWEALCRHTNLKKNDWCICELLEENGVAGCIIKVHIIGGNST
ncbi:B3 domain-containing protein At5g25475 [Eucalyptus grandis]|uniref:B3 domain-containing protein At5g25475 n=1 Tax=Eucalyptus grandis TaxID=71139 RepID=UPI00192E8765|nr:B3 domain-containing protein At5g25475 [Eucalyptus grandis]